MANWVYDFLTRNPDMAALPVYKRARNGLHFKQGSNVVAHFTGRPVHYDNGGVWTPIDTTLLPASGGFYGAQHSDVLVHPDGRVQIAGTGYQQYTALPGAPVGLVNGDSIVREFSGGRQVITMTEDGLIEIITLDTLPSLTGAKAAQYLTQITGTKPTKYQFYDTIFIDAKKKVYVYQGNNTTLKAWLTAATYPVTIDPDFNGGTGDIFAKGEDVDYSPARDTLNTVFSNTSASIQTGQLFDGDPGYSIYRSWILFDTSTIGAGGTVTQVNLKLVAATDNSGTDFNVKIVKSSWAGGTINEAAWDAVLTDTLDDAIWRNTSEMSVNTQYTSGNLATAWINKTGTTYYSLVSDRDKSNTAPSDAEYITIASANHGTASYRPVLTVVYSGGGGVPKQYLHLARQRL